jgi:hypothetical protein
LINWLPGTDSNRRPTAIDRIGRSLGHLVEFMDELRQQGVGLYLHQQQVDTSTAAGRAFLQMAGVFAEFERAIIVERINAGLARAKAQGKKPVGLAYQAEANSVFVTCVAKDSASLKSHARSGAASRQYSVCLLDSGLKILYTFYLGERALPIGDLQSCGGTRADCRPMRIEPASIDGSRPHSATLISPRSRHSNWEMRTLKPLRARRWVCRLRIAGTNGWHGALGKPSEVHNGAMAGTRRAQLGCQAARQRQPRDWS